MKRFIFILAMSIISTIGFSQNHMKFMGIPIDGNVYTFCEQLQKKGFHDNNERTQTAISYSGKFFGEDAYLDITYNPLNNIVYQVNVSIVKRFAFQLSSIQREIMQTIESKYVYDKKTGDSELNQYSYYIYDFGNPVGMIQLSLLDTSSFYRNSESMLTILYLDIDNYLKYQDRIRNDI